MRTAARSWDRRDGYLTVFMALVLPLILSLYFALLQGARMNASRLEVTCAADASTDAVMAEFSAALFSRYDLFFIDTSYGSGSPSDAALEERLNYYFGKNLAPAPVLSVFGAGSFTGLSGAGVFLTGTRHAQDAGFLPLREQIGAYMTADPAGAALSEVTRILDLWQGLPVDTQALSSGMEGTKKQMEDLMKKSRDRKEDTREEGDAEGEETGEGEAENTLEGLAELLRQPLLTQVLGEGAEVSEVQADLSGLFSHRSISGGTGLYTENSHGTLPASSLMLDLYIAEKCGCRGNVREGSLLQYQLEYILHGRDSDRANLEKTLEELLLVRLALNSLYLLQDPGKQAELESAAASLSLTLLIPEFEPALKAVLLGAWSYLESIRDLKALMKGERVPLIKTGETWKTGIEGLLHGETEGAPEESPGTGMTYGEYLQILLFMEGTSLRCSRLMDVMEMDLRRTPGNSLFCMDGCVDAFSMEAAAFDALGFAYTVIRNETYN